MIEGKGENPPRSFFVAKFRGKATKSYLYLFKHFNKVQHSDIKHSGTFFQMVLRKNFPFYFHAFVYLIFIIFIFSGVPPPRVTWSRGGRLIDETFHVLANGTVRNEISFHAVDRSGSIKFKLTFAN